MLITEIEYRGKTLCVKAKGSADMKEVGTLKQTIYRILQDYGIRDLYLDFSDAYNVDISMFEEFYPNYFLSYSSSGLSKSKYF